MGKERVYMKEGSESEKLAKRYVNKLVVCLFLGVRLVKKAGPMKQMVRLGTESKSTKPRPKHRTGRAPENEVGNERPVRSASFWFPFRNGAVDTRD